MIPNFLSRASKIDQQYIGRVEEEGTPDKGFLLKVTPDDDDSEGMRKAIDLLRALHRPNIGLTGYLEQNPIYSFEIWWEGGRIHFFFHVPDEESKFELLKQIDTQYSGSQVEEIDKPLPELQKDTYISSANFRLEKRPTVPIRTMDMTDSFEGDPFGSVLSDMVGDKRDKMAVQIMFQPAGRKWYKDGLLFKDAMQRGESLRDGTVSGQLNPEIIDASKKDKKIANDAQGLVGTEAYHFNLRVFSASPNKDRCIDNIKSLTGKLKRMYGSSKNQELDPSIYRRHTGTVVNSLIRRRMAKPGIIYSKLIGHKNILPLKSLAGLVHLPDGGIEVSDIEWSRTKQGNRPPADMEEFDG